MRSIFMVLPFIVLTFLCWGNYGPLMHEGQHGMGGGSLRPFVGVGLAYFLIAVVVPIFVLVTKGETGRWTVSGTIWALAAGVAGAIGALGIVMAFKNLGSPVYVMPLVFGLAPVVNTFVTMLMSRTYKEGSVVFYAAVTVVALGAAGVMFFKPSPANINITKLDDGSIQVAKTSTADGSTKTWTAANEEALKTDPKLRIAKKLYLKKNGPSPQQFLYVLLSIATTALCWGSYGPVLHKGQAKMEGSRLRPFLCVGLSYFAIAVIVPLLLLNVFPEDGGWMHGGSPAGLLWSMAAGAAGAVGALGIILAFNFGGTPIFVMPLVFGGAPVVNTFTSVIVDGTFRQISAPFLVSLALVICGAVTVLITAPRPKKPGGKPKPPTDDPMAERLDAAADGATDSAQDAAPEQAATE